LLILKNFKMRDWKTYKLEDLGKIVTGKTPSSKHPEHFGNHLPFVTPTDFSDYHKNVRNASRCLSSEGAKHFKSKILPPNSVLVTCIGSQMGKVVVNKSHVLTNQQLNSIIPNKKTSSDFLYYKLSSIHEQLRIMAGAGSTMPMLNKTDFGKIEIEIPEIEEQKAIASILSSLDDKIEINLQMNKILEEMAMALYKHWFVDFGPFQDGEFVDSELGEIPKGWEVKKLPEISKNHNKKRKPISTRERAKRPGKYPYYGATKILDYIDNYKFDGEFILLAEDGTVKTERDTPFLQFVEGKFWVSNHAHVLTGNDKYSNEFLYLSLNNKNITPIITGAVQLKINKGNLETLQFITPPEDILKSFEDLIIPLFQSQKSIILENETLTRLRDTLLPKLISGEVRVKDIKKTLSEVL
jgi:type I restriction enzyme, S subunit